MTEDNTDGSDQGMIDAALEIAREWGEDVDQLCAAVLTDDVETAKRLARKLQGTDL
jgi:hypothetical protein